MAAAPGFLSLEQFERLYQDEKPHYEYWFGGVEQKAMPTSLHGVLQVVLAMLLMRRGWKTASEVRLKISSVAHPVPDVIADLKRIQTPYPTEPFDLCIEILSPSDDLKGTFQKAAHYLDWGIRCVWIIDGERRKAYSMSLEHPNPIELGISDSLTAGTPAQPFLPLQELFDEVDKNLGAE
jgi:Uma2 family endonuclease